MLRNLTRTVLCRVTLITYQTLVKSILKKLQRWTASPETDGEYGDTPRIQVQCFPKRRRQFLSLLALNTRIMELSSIIITHVQFELLEFNASLCPKIFNKFKPFAFVTFFHYKFVFIFAWVESLSTATTFL